VCTPFSLRDPAIFDGYANLDVLRDGTVPVIVTFNYAESTLLGLEQLERNAPNESVIARAKEVREGVLGTTKTFYYSVSDDDGQKVSTGSVEMTIVGVIPSQSLLLELANIFGNIDNATELHIKDNGANKEFTDFIASTQQTGRLTRVVEFDTKEQLRTFAEDNCNFSDYSCSGSEKVFFRTDPYLNYEVPFELTSKQAWKFFRYVVLFFVFTSAASIYGTMGKIIVDSRRETGVFRAIGASRLQIGQIYLTYITIISVLAFVLSAIIALCMNFYLTSRFASGFETELALVTGTAVSEQSFSFVGFNVPLIVLCLLATILIGWIGSLIPIVRSLRRDPIRYLREE
jgi:ABC-type antimicrobial peptide transport system permease subunit